MTNLDLEMSQRKLYVRQLPGFWRGVGQGLVVLHVCGTNAQALPRR